MNVLAFEISVVTLLLITLIGAVFHTCTFAIHKKMHSSILMEVWIGLCLLIGLGLLCPEPLSHWFDTRVMVLSFLHLIVNAGNFIVSLFIRSEIKEENENFDAYAKLNIIFFFAFLILCAFYSH